MPDVFYPDGFRKLNTPREWRYEANYDTRGLIWESTIDYVLTSDDLTFSQATRHNWRAYDEDGNLSFPFASDHPAISEKICHGNVSYMVPILDSVLYDENEL